MSASLNSNLLFRPPEQYGPFQILAIDGGGFRGLFAAQCLALWEKATGRRAADCFDLITGTSTGGILTLGLGLGLSASQLVDFYCEDGRKIFPTHAAARWYRACRRWLLPEFSQRQLQSALQQRLGTMSRLGDSRTRLVIPAYDLTVRRPYLFKTDHHPDYKYDWARPAWEIAMATTAAPTYFPFYTSSWKTVYVDGGVWANNPSYLGAFEATQVLGVPVEHLRILNLGTGIPRAGAGTVEFKNRLGIAGWAAGITDLVLDANALAVGGIMERIHRENYVRITPAVDAGRLPLDRYAPAQLLALAEERARFSAGAAESFFQHSARSYTKHQTGKVRMEIST